jgi:3-hydroxybutyryl-CoA dehydrogenase
MEHNPTENLVGVVGLGLMGCSIATDLLIHEINVVAVAPISEDLDHALDRITHNLEIAYKNGFSKFTSTDALKRLKIEENYSELAQCELVLECVVENVEVKKSVYQKIENVVSRKAFIGTNTSAIPISILKDFLKYPDRFMGMHYAEPSFTTKFLEIICSEQTDIAKAETLYQKVQQWGKEPTLVRKDIRGFITNRIMYAMYREAFYLVENGYATIEDVDRTCRNDGGHWMPFCGLFRYMDITGLQAYYKVMGDLFPTLNNQTHTPELIEKIAKAGGNGIVNGKGFYDYTPQEAAEWEKAYEEFAFDISRLSAKYPIDLVKQRLNGNGKH